MGQKVKTANGHRPLQQQPQQQQQHHQQQTASPLS